MGESACLMQPFSYAAGLPSDAPEGNPLHALGQSISFGRFMTEKLDWERWSTFSSQNQYVAEAERYSRPGSVAQKKAFFEAHYKQLAAARKAAAEALLQQENKPAPGNAMQPESEPEKLAAQEDVKGQHKKGFRSKSDLETREQGKREVAGEDSAEGRKALVENPNKVDSEKKHEAPGGDDDNNNQEMVSATFQKENLLKFETKISDLNKRNKDSSAKEKMEKTVLKSLNGCEEDSKPISNKKFGVSSSSSNYGKAFKSSNAMAKPAALAHSQKETITTPISRKPKLNSSEKTRMTPKSSYKSYNFTPAKEFNRLASIIRKIDGPRAVSSTSKPSEDCKTPLRTPNKISASGVGKNPLSTPLSDNRRGKVAPDSAAKAGKTARARWNFLPTESKLYSPSCFTPFRLRTEERAERRKKKLEEKFKATEAQKQQQQEAAFKENAEKEQSKLRQRLCFKARPLPNFYRQRRTATEQTKKALLQHQESPAAVVETKPDDSKISAMQNKTSNGSQRSLMSNLRSKYVRENKD